MTIFINKNEKKVRKIPAFLNLIALCQLFFGIFLLFFSFFISIKKNSVENKKKS